MAAAVRSNALRRWIRMRRSSRAISGRPCEPMKAAWLRLAVIAHNVPTALKRIALPAELLRAHRVACAEDTAAAGRAR